jgi:hypothetical protein
MWFGWFIGVVELPAIAVVGFWFVFQYVAAFMELESGVSDGVAYWDHLGGFVAGVAGIWGTIFYLKHQLANAPEGQPGDEGPASEAAAASKNGDGEPADAPRDAFDDFLPRSDTFERGTALPGPLERIFEERNQRFTGPS